MYIRLESDEHLLIRTVEGRDGLPREVVLCGLGHDPELNLFLAAQQGRSMNPDEWDGIHDYHLLQALENYKRRMGNHKPALVVISGNRPPHEDASGTDEGAQ